MASQARELALEAARILGTKNPNAILAQANAITALALLVTADHEERDREREEYRRRQEQPSDTTNAL